MKTITWTARIRSAPTAVRYCKRCGTKTEFASSGRFRINAQQKNLDVWLIYRCSHCETTWNLSIYSHIHPQSIPAEQLRGFHENDPDMAMGYAANAALVRLNGAEPGRPEIEVDGADIDLADAWRITLTSEISLDVRVEAVLRHKLGLSASELEKLLASGRITCVSNHNIKKHKLSGDTVVVEIKPE